MKLTSIEIHPAGSSDVHILSFQDPTRLNPYNVISIGGLDVDSIVPKQYGDGNYDMTLVDRQPVMKVQLNPRFEDNETYSDLRDALYRAISSSRTGLIEFQFKNGEVIVATLSGWVVKMEASLSEPSPQVQLTIKSLDPMLVSPDVVNVDLTGMTSDDFQVQDDLSTAPHGFVLEAQVGGVDIVGTIDLRCPDAFTKFSFSSVISGFVVGDVIHISSERNKKDLYIQRDEARIYIADGIQPGSVWPMIFPRENQFSFSYFGDPYQLTLLSLEHYPTYWGV